MRTKTWKRRYRLVGRIRNQSQELLVMVIRTTGEIDEGMKGTYSGYSEVVLQAGWFGLCSGHMLDSLDTLLMLVVVLHCIIRPLLACSVCSQVCLIESGNSLHMKLSFTLRDAAGISSSLSSTYRNAE
jgi:hypothetical protein